MNNNSKELAQIRDKEKTQQQGELIYGNNL